MPDVVAPRFSQRSQWAKDQAISFLMQQAVENRDVISLAAGLVDEASLPVIECGQSVDHLFDDAAQRGGGLDHLPGHHLAVDGSRVGDAEQERAHEGVELLLGVRVGRDAAKRRMLAEPW